LVKEQERRRPDSRRRGRGVARGLRLPGGSPPEKGLHHTVLERVEADPAFAGAAGVVVLHAEALEDLNGAVVHPDRNAEVELAHRSAQQVAGRLVETENLGCVVELFLCRLEGLVGSASHGTAFRGLILISADAETGVVRPHSSGA